MDYQAMKQVSKMLTDRELQSLKPKENDHREEIYGVFNGGGAKGAAFAGSIQIYEKNARWKEVAGASAGAITAALIAAGYDGATIENIVGNLNFPKLMDLFSLNEVKEAAYRWQFEENVDYLTGLLREIDPSMLQPESDLEIEKQLNEFLEKKRWKDMGWLEWIGSGIEYYASYVTAPVIDTIRDNLRWYGTGIIGWWNDDTANYVYDALNAWCGSRADSRRESLAKLLMSTLGDKLPPAILVKMLKENSDEPDTDKVLSLILGLYYKGGAFKGQAFLKVMEELLQLAVRPKKERDLTRPVTFRELPIPLRVMTSDISRSCLLSFPNGLNEYGYAADDEAGELKYMDFSVAEAVRASMSIPMVYQPYYLKHENRDGAEGEPVWSTLVDGGMLSNFPVGQFGWQSKSAPVCGFWLGPDPGIVPLAETDRVFSYVTGLLNSMMEAYDKTMMHRYGEKIVITAIDMTIPRSSKEMEQFNSPEVKEGKKKTLEAQKKELDKLEEIVEKLKKSKKIVAKESGLENQDKMLAHIERRLKLVTNSVKDAKKLIAKAAKPPEKIRKCGTLDFNLTDEQKKALIANGRKAAEESYKKWKGK